jgi:hypothetical protein
MSARRSRAERYKGRLDSRNSLAAQQVSMLSTCRSNSGLGSEMRTPSTTRISIIKWLIFRLRAPKRANSMSEPVVILAPPLKQRLMYLDCKHIWPPPCLTVPLATPSPRSPWPPHNCAKSGGLFFRQSGPYLVPCFTSPVLFRIQPNSSALILQEHRFVGCTRDPLRIGPLHLCPECSLSFSLTFTLRSG